MKKTVLLATAAMLAMSVGGIASAAPQHPKMAISGAKAAKFAHSPTDRKTTVLWDQNSDDSGSAASSQNFETSFDVYDDQAADDFVIPKGATWKIKEVDVTGQYSISGPADSENVFIYKNKKGKPSGDPIGSYLNLKGKDNGAGSFVIKIPKAKVLKKGTYWLSVQVNMDFNPNGQWYWEDTTTLQNGNPAQWQNPGGGFGVCPTWTLESTCVGSGLDHLFTIKGTATTK